LVLIRGMCKSFLSNSDEGSFHAAEESHARSVRPAAIRLHVPSVPSSRSNRGTQSTPCLALFSQRIVGVDSSLYGLRVPSKTLLSALFSVAPQCCVSTELQECA